MSSKLRLLIGDDNVSAEELKKLARDYCKISTDGDKIRTKQEFKDDVNINTIMAKVRRGQLIDPDLLSYKKIPMYGDFSNVPDLATAHQIVKDAADDFSRLPSNIKKRFNQDPVKLVEFMQDESNRAEAETLGLIPKPEPEPAPKPTEEPLAPSADA